MAFVVVFSFGEKAKNGGYTPGFSLDNYAKVIKGADPVHHEPPDGVHRDAADAARRAARSRTSSRPGPAGTRACSSCSSSSRSGRASSSGPTAGSSSSGPRNLGGFIGSILGDPDFKILGHAVGDHARARLRLPAADGLPAVRDAGADGPDAHRGVQGPRRGPLGDVPPDHLADGAARASSPAASSSSSR